MIKDVEATMQKDIERGLAGIGSHNQEELVFKNITKPQRKLLSIAGWSIISLIIMLMVAIYVSQTIDSAANKAADKVIEYIKSQES